MRHYYDVYSLLQRPEVKAFIGTDAYKAHKAKRFLAPTIRISRENEAFVLSDRNAQNVRKGLEETSALYYGNKPTFDQMLKEIAAWADRL